MTYVIETTLNTGWNILCLKGFDLIKVIGQLGRNVTKPISFDLRFNEEESITFRRISNKSVNFAWVAITFGEVICRKKPEQIFESTRNDEKRKTSLHRYFSWSLALDKVKRRILNEWRSNSSADFLRRETFSIVRLMIRQYFTRKWSPKEIEAESRPSHRLMSL